MQLNALASSLGRFFSELQRRKVLRVASAYVVAGWIILQVAVALQTAMSLPAWFSTIIISLLIIGFPIALVVSWFFDFTPDGIKRTTASGDGVLLKPQTTDFILVGMLALVLVVAVVQAVVPRDSVPTATTATAEAPKPKPEPPALGDKSIAVLPFVNLSPDKENEYFADGLTEELLSLLAKIGDLKVISRTSSFAFKGKNTPLPEIAKQLGVRHILEGSVRRDGDDLRVTAQLIDVATDTHLWSETYDRKIENIFAVQEEIAKAVAGSLDLELTMSAGRLAPTQNMEAYRVYLKTRQLYFRRAPGDLLESIDLCKRAIALDPEFADAHATLAFIYMAEGTIAEGLRSAARYKELAPLARQSAQTALKLNPKLALAYTTLAGLAAIDLRWEDAINISSKALSLDPADSRALAQRGTFQFTMGMFETAARTLAEAVRIDPLNPFTPSRQLGNAFVRGDDHTAAALATRMAQSSNAFRTIGYWYLAYFAQAKGDHAQAEKYFRAFMDAWGRNKSVIEPVASALTSRVAVGAAVRALKAEEAVDPSFEPSRLFLLIGDENALLDYAIDRLASGDTSRTNFQLAMAWRLIVEGKGANPKLKALFRKAGLVDYWKKHGWPDRCRARGEDDVECS